MLPAFQAWAYQNIFGEMALPLLLIFLNGKVFKWVVVFVLGVTFCDVMWVFFGGHGIYLGNTMSAAIGMCALFLWREL